MPRTRKPAASGHQGPPRPRPPLPSKSPPRIGALGRPATGQGQRADQCDTLRTKTEGCRSASGTSATIWSDTGDAEGTWGQGERRGLGIGRVERCPRSHGVHSDDRHPPHNHNGPL